MAHSRNRQRWSALQRQLLISRRGFLWLSGAVLADRLLPAQSSETPSREMAHVSVRDEVPDPKPITFTIHPKGQPPLRLQGHYWISRKAAAKGEKLPALVELNPYRRRDGMLLGDSDFYPWFAYHGYLCCRVDLQGSGDSDGILRDEYTQEELDSCVEVVEQLAAHPLCNGKVGMLGWSWSAINSLMVAARDDCPKALKAVLIVSGTDDRYSDDVHTMNGAMMQDQFDWASLMWGWLTQPPDPLVVGDQWQTMWRDRLNQAEFWFATWASHPTRDAYWSQTSVRDLYAKVKVPVNIISGYRDIGYSNPVAHVMAGLTAAGKPVEALLGPWGHASPNTGYPGPRIDWLPHLLHHWWDRWLKDQPPPTGTAWPPFTVWLGSSREPDRSPATSDSGRWVAEDGHWQERSQPLLLHLTASGQLLAAPPAQASTLQTPRRIAVATTTLENGSWGHSDNDDLPGDQRDADRDSLTFDSLPLREDLDVFGFPSVMLTLASNVPKAVLVLRLCELSPHTQASRLVSYRFFNLCFRSGDMARPERLKPGEVFSVRIPMNVIGHTFRKGWSLRLSLSTSLFPVLWTPPDLAVLTLTTGPRAPFPVAALELPRRVPRQQDGALASLLPSGGQITSIDPNQFVPTVSRRPGDQQRRLETIQTPAGPRIRVERSTDAGAVLYKGLLKDLLVEQVTREIFTIDPADPLSHRGQTSMVTTMERKVDGKVWNVRCTTHTALSSSRDSTGEPVFHYQARLQAEIADSKGKLRDFINRTIQGTLPRPCF